MPTKSSPLTREESSKTFTNWSAFEKANLIPTTIVCDVIHGHPDDEACKTRLTLASKSLLHHASVHGGGFQVKVQQDPRKWKGWQELAEAGMEIVELRCEACDGQVEVSTRDILNHLRPHKGKFRGAFENFRNIFFIRIQPTTKDVPDAISDNIDQFELF